MSATSFRSTESANELVFMSSVSSFNEDTDSVSSFNEVTNLPELENTTGKSKASHWQPVVVMFLLILVLSLIIGLAIEANTTSKETQFISTSTLFYNMTVPPAKPITTTPETSFCGDQVWISDGQCDDESNKIYCQYDGGDCCLPNATLTFCIKCICHLTGYRHDHQITKESNERALVVIGGRLIESSAEDSSTEVISESKDFTNQYFASYPDEKVGTCGGLVDDVIIVCGGTEEYDIGYTDILWDTVSRECYLFSPLDNEWKPIHTMDKPRVYAASIGNVQFFFTS